MNHRYNGCAWIKKGLCQPEEGFFFVGFFFSYSSGTLRSMTIKRYDHLCPKRVTSSHNLVNSQATCSSTISKFVYAPGILPDNLCFLGAPAFWCFRERIERN